MKIRSFIGAGVLATVAAGVIAPTPANAAADTTTVEFTLSTGALSIDAPAAADLTPVDPVAATAGTVVGDIGNTTVTDARNSLAGWTVSASSDAFDRDVDGSGVIDGTEGAGNQIPATNVRIQIPADNAVTANLRGVLDGDLGAAFAPVVNGTTGAVGGNIGILAGGSLTGLLGLGSSTHDLTYIPEVTVTIPGGAVAGTYVGTVTQTVI